MDAMLRDLRFGLRQLRLNPTFTIVAVLSLALGIGANAAIFQLIDAVRLRTLPVEKPQELALIDWVKGSQRSGWWSSRSANLTYPQFEQIRDRAQAFSGTMAWSARQFNLADGGQFRLAEGLFVSGDFFKVLGVSSMLGRTLTAEDDRPGCGAPSAVISYAFWQREFGGDASVLGRNVRLGGRPIPIAGVTPAGFFGVEVGNRFDVAVPMCADPLFSDDGKGRISDRHAWWLSVMGRLKPGWTVERANAEIQTLTPGILEATLPPVYRPEGAKAYLANKLTVVEGGTGVSNLRRGYENPLWILLATTGLVLLIACANLANLLLARASVREREIAVRQAIGASRGRLIGQLLAESLLLALFGTALGALLAQALSRGLVAFLATQGNALFVGLRLDARVLGFMAGVAILTCLLFGLAPAIRATNIAPASAMRTGGRGITTGRERFGLRRILVVAQVSLSLVLLVGAFLFVRSLQKLLDVQPGFRAEGVVSVAVDLSTAHYSKERIPGVYRDILDRLRLRTGAVSAAQVAWTPVSQAGWDETTWDGSNGAKVDVLYNRTGPGYFKTMDTAFLAGRDFDDRDDLTAPKIAIVNEAFAQKIFGGGNPIGRTFRVQGQAGKPDPMYQVVGLVRNTKYYELREDFRPIAFLPLTQDENPDTDTTYVMRTSASIGPFLRAATAAVAEVNPGLGIQFTILSTQLKESLMRERLMATLAGAFGLLAGSLAVLGLYGVVAYMVARRRNEIGVRIALGAGRGRVIRLVLREAAVLLGVGLAVGVGLSLWAARAAISMLYDLKPYDPVTLGGAVLLLATVALIASYAPARRASRLDPMDALREE
jgi:predicted permease